MNYGLKNLQESLSFLQGQCTGLFKLHTLGNFFTNYEPVISRDEHTTETLVIKHLYGADHNHYSNAAGQYHKFPNNKTLSQMIENPFELKEFIDSITKEE